MSNFLKTAEIRRVLLLKKLARVSRTLSIKRAAAEQLRKYASAARLIREQREMQKQAESYRSGGVPNHFWSFLQGVPWVGRTLTAGPDSKWLDHHIAQHQANPGNYISLSPAQWERIRKLPGVKTQTYLGPDDPSSAVNMSKVQGSHYGTRPKN